VATVGFVTAWVTGMCVALALGAAACGGDSDADARPTTTAAERTTSSSTTTAPERAASTTTTAYDPAAVEGQVEAAYLKSWDVYAEAVYNLELDEAALAEVFADPLLTVLREELRERIDEGRAAYVLVDHSYTIEMTGPDTAAVIDRYTNHQVLIDPESKTPIEPDPDKVIVDAFTLRRFADAWVVNDQRRIK
jgi:hypothetical protein